MQLSIITINYNNEKGLEATLKSVSGQISKAFEFIVIDGGSTDGSLELIDKYKDKIDYWVSEKDNGIYHAMNKGIAKANGDYLLMLNSGDCLSDETVIQKCNDDIASSIEDILCYSFFWKNSQGLLEVNGYPPLSYGYFRKHSISHQATLIKRGLHTTTGLYDESLKIII